MCSGKGKLIPWQRTTTSTTTQLYWGWSIWILCDGVGVGGGDISSLHSCWQDWKCAQSFGRGQAVKPCGEQGGDAHFLSLCCQNSISTKTIWPVMQAQEIFSLQNFLFSTQMCLWMIFIFRWNPMNIFLKLQLHTHHSLDFIRELKMLKITGYIHLHYKIPFYVAMLALVSFFFFFW